MNVKRIFLLIFIVTIIFSFNNIVFAADSEIDNQTYNNYKASSVSCGYNKNKEALMSDIPKSIPKITHILYLGLEIAVPVVLVIFGMLDLFKGLSAQKDEEIKRGQQIFIKRVIPAILIFLMLLIIKLVIGFVSDKNSGRIVSCMECFVNNDCG